MLFGLIKDIKQSMQHCPEHHKLAQIEPSAQTLVGEHPTGGTHFVSGVVGSYAEAVRRTNPATQRKPQRSAIIIKPESDGKTDRPDINKIEKSITETLMSNDIDATIHSVLPMRNGNVKVLFDEKDNVSHIAEKFSSNLGYEAKPRTLITPKLTITHVPEFFDVNQNLRNDLLHANPRIKQLTEDGEDFDVLFTYKVKDLTSIVCKASPKIRQYIMNGERRLKVGMRSCPVKDRIHVMQCGKCLRFGHKTSLCKDPEPICAFCTHHHKSTDCTLKKDNAQHECINCQRLRGRSGLNCEHNAFSETCPVFVTHKKKAISNTNWGAGDPPTL